MKSLSIIIPVYNGERFIEHCIESIAMQDNGRIEVILVNDGSKDNTSKICADLAKKYSFIKYFEKENGGVSSARNFALNKISGEYVWFIDADDTVQNDAIEEIFKIETDLAIFNFVQFDGNREQAVHLVEQDYLYKLTSFDDFFQEYVFRYKLNNALWNKVFKASIIKEKGLLFNENIKIGEDYLFSLLYYKFISNISFSIRSIYRYFVNPSGAMKNKNKKVFEYQSSIARIIKDNYRRILGTNVLQQFLLMQLICGINQSIEREVLLKHIKHEVKNYMQEVMGNRYFTKTVVNNFLKSENAGFLSKIRFKLKYKKLWRHG